MKISKDRKDGTLHIHLDGEKGVYVGLTHGISEHGHYGSTYISLDCQVAISIAKQILAKYREEAKCKPQQ